MRRLPEQSSLYINYFDKKNYLGPRARSRERRNALVDALTRELGDMLDVTVPEAGMHLVAWLPSGMSAQIAIQRAAASGLHILPISQFSLRSLQRDGLLLGFASSSPQELPAGVQTLASALQAH